MSVSLRGLKRCLRADLKILRFAVKLFGIETPKEGSYQGLGEPTMCKL